MDRGGRDENADDNEFECDNVFGGDCDNDNDLECVIDLDFASKSCDWYSEGIGKYVCRGDAQIRVRSPPRECILL